MKIYTKTGDKGMTSLIGGVRVPKNSIRLESYGTVDELNSYLGMIRSYPVDPLVAGELVEIQSRLFDVGGYLATAPQADQVKIRLEIRESDIQKLEEAIDGGTGPSAKIFCAARRKSACFFLPYCPYSLPEGRTPYSGFNGRGGS